MPFVRQYLFKQQLTVARRFGRHSRFIFGTCLTAFLALVFASTMAAQTSFTTLYNFSGIRGDGAHPVGDLSIDSQGALYGLSTSGHAKIYKLTPPASGTGLWTKTTLYDSNSPGAPATGNFSPVLLGKNGELYGTARYCAGGPFEAGCIFQLVPPVSPGGAWGMNILAYFHFGGGDGSLAQVLTKPAMDAHGNLFGVTHNNQRITFGTVWEVSPPVTPGGAWTSQVLLNFTWPFSYEPQDGLAVDQNGAVYGSTLRGYFKGIFQLTPPATSGGPWFYATRLASVWFGDCSGLTIGPSGAVYGVGFYPLSPLGVGAFELDPSGTLTPLPFTTGFGEGWELASDANGVLYGTDRGLPGSTNPQTVYKLTPPASPGGAWTYSLLYTFDGSEGVNPIGRLVVDSSGHLFGVTIDGGTGSCKAEGYGGSVHKPGCGTVFELQ
jgi:hypothetical protein